MIDGFGLALKDNIIAAAEYLTLSDSRPGLIAALLLIATLVLGAHFFFRTSRQLNALKEFDRRVRSFDSIESFAEGFADFQHTLKQDYRRKGPRDTVWEAWDEFNETIVLDDIDDGPVRLRNSIRPASFLNVEDLGFGSGLFRILPNTFVSIGLFLTFLGLVAALHQFAQSMGVAGGAGMDQAMRDFMQIASAKFIMSLVGLLCSIVFTVLLRARQNNIDHAVTHLCTGIERRLVFVSLEDIGFRQLRAATEQREHLREIGFAMVAELQKPLEALPEKITSAIAERMDPIFDRVTAMGTSNMEGLVGDLSEQLSHSVGNALTRASESLEEATDRIGRMVDRMGQTNTQAGDGLRDALDQMARAMSEMRTEVASSGRTASDAMTEGADRLLSVMNETLQGIRVNTGEGAEAMRSAAQEMRTAAESFRDTLASASEDSARAAQERMAQSSAEAGEAIQGAGRSMLDSFKQTSVDIAELGSSMGSVIGGELLSRLEAVGAQLETLADAVQRGATGAQSAAQGLNTGADAIHGASEGFRSASQSLVSAAEPIRASQERIESTLRRVGELVETVSETLMQNSASVAENAAHVLDAAQAALGNEREGIRRSLEATRAAMAQLSNEAEKLDQIDVMLGRALTQYNAQLEAALGTAQDHVGQMRDTLAPGLDTLKSVVEQAELFLPSQRRDRT
jgi:ABC-type transporter Mla subunit MlaD/NADH:ubiquinone oxidoreductase subunit 6 (subunit J)